MRASAKVFSAFLFSLFICSSAHALAEAPPLFDEALDISVQLDPDTDKQACLKAWNELLGNTRDALKKAKGDGVALDAPAVIAVLNRELLRNREVTYISNLYWRDSLFTSVLLKRRGNCLATSLLYYLVARELKLPIFLATLPEHAFVRWDDGKSIINIETTRGGEAFTDDFVMKALDLSDIDLKQNSFLKSLNQNQTRALLNSVWSGVFWTLNQKEKSLTLLKLAQDLDPGNVDILLTKAFELVQAGSFAPAEVIYKAVLSKDTGPWRNSTLAMYYSGLLEARGRFDDAIEVLISRYESAPRRQKAHMVCSLGILLRHKRDFDRAIPFHYQYCLLNPCAESYDHLGSVLTEAHKDREAIAAYEKALEYNPESFFTKVILAGLYERAGDKERGRAYFAKIEKPRDHIETWYGALVWYYANIKEEQLMLDNMKLGLKVNRAA
jgi:tetratricopeptide (TPR) repeat protein